MGDRVSQRCARLGAVAREHNMKLRMLEAVDEINDLQKHVLFEKVERHFDGNLTGRKIALWGLAFKPRTDDIREAPSLVLIDHLLKAGAEVHVHDPVAMENVRKLHPTPSSFTTTTTTRLMGSKRCASSPSGASIAHPILTT